MAESEDSVDLNNKVGALNNKLADQLMDIGYNLEVWNFLYHSETQEETDRKNEILKIHSGVFLILQRSVYMYIVVELRKLVATKTSEISIIKYLNKSEQELSGSLCEERRSRIASQRNQLTSCSIVKKLSKLRDKSVAHNDKQYFLNVERVNEEIPISIVEIQELIKSLRDIIDWHREKLLGLSAFSWFEGTGKDDVREFFRQLEILEVLKGNHSMIYSQCVEQLKRSEEESNSIWR